VGGLGVVVFWFLVCFFVVVVFVGGVCVFGVWLFGLGFGVGGGLGVVCFGVVGFWWFRVMF
jgi:hypothetical protein